ncbi:MAG: hypothetical protein GY734_21665 [Herbaspirillum sp.]|uniref:hypothetical protein n=1 Tax=Herbaspirillum sp. TaxID=1890675 RepID=UPI002588045C|nr:hypothetical protein [Herbaspirillum sp.]MCP3658474.1 hypothetical protein [Herbaspirillum sp.]MCP3950090.1 hypothetical protein [Herbaspirillum sp.]MCP4033827.1 hypothetical protein [Herbaspirillum sp.]
MVKPLFIGLSKLSFRPFRPISLKNNAERKKRNMKRFGGVMVGIMVMIDGKALIDKGLRAFHPSIKGWI